MHARTSTPNHPRSTSRSTAGRIVVMGLAAAATSTALAVAAPAATAAPSCAGVVISAQGTSGPQVVSDRVHEIKREILPFLESALPFGQAIRGLAQEKC